MSIPTRFEFKVGGYLGSSYEFVFNSGRLEYRTFGYGFEPKTEASLVVSDEEWQRFREAVEQLHIWDWQSDYEVPVLDGTEWSLRLQYGDQAIESSGSNGYPGDPPSSTEGPEYSRAFNRFLEAVNHLLDGLSFRDVVGQEVDDG